MSPPISPPPPPDAMTTSPVAVAGRTGNSVVRGSDIGQLNVVAAVAGKTQSREGQTESPK